MPRTILCIDDDPMILELLRAWLKPLGFEVLATTDGNEGYTIAQKSHPDLVLLDIAMPGLDGFATCQLLKENWRTKEILVVMLTVSSQKEDVMQALKAGADDYIIKTADSQLFLSKICHILDLDLNDLQLAADGRLAEDEPPEPPDGQPEEGGPAGEEPPPQDQQEDGGGEEPSQGA